MSLGKITDVEMCGAGVMLTIEVQGLAEPVVVSLEEGEAIAHAVAVQDRLDQPARERAIDQAQRNLDAFAGERYLSILASEDCPISAPQ